MKIIIEIPEEIYNHTQEYEVGGFNQENDTKLFIAIKNGTPLPEHHGRLIDADELKKHKYHDNNRYENAVAVAQIDWAPTIIEGSEN